jgi:hypothetical protein
LTVYAESKKLNNNKHDEYGGVLRPVPVQGMRRIGTKIGTKITGEEIRPLWEIGEQQQRVQNHKIFTHIQNREGKNERLLSHRPWYDKGGMEEGDGWV